MKSNRMFGILSILLDKKQVTAKELAEYFEVSVRTIHRDLLDLSSAGFPVITQQGVGGGISLMPNFRYPFRNYNLFQYVYVLSFYDHAKKDCRFLEALDVLKSKTQDGQIVVERVVPKLGKLSFCKKGKPSISATKRYNEILHNLG